MYDTIGGYVKIPVILSIQYYILLTAFAVERLFLQNESAWSLHELFREEVLNLTSA